MMRKRCSRVALTVEMVVTVAIGGSVSALTTHHGAAQRAALQTIPVRTLAAPLAVSRDTFGLMLLVREVSDKHVLVNDGLRKRLVLLDSALILSRIVLDTVPGRDDSYGPRPEPVIPYLGDTTIFVDTPSRSLIMIGPHGNLGRTIAAPNDPGMFLLAATSGGVDDRGRLLFRGIAISQQTKPGGSNLMVEMNGGAAPTSNADSVPIIRGNFQTRAVDTLGALANINASRLVDTVDATGRQVLVSYLNPRASGDEWAVVSDGTIAIVRGRDYHVEWITSDNQKSSTGKMPFDWKRITDEEKVRLRDSTNNTMSHIDSMEVMLKARVAAAGGEGSLSRRSGDGTATAMPADRPVRKSVSVQLSDIPDYEPAIRPGAVMADRDNNLWILPTTSAQSLHGELVYDVVNRRGELTERVRLPLGRSVIGFGRGGVVYLMHGNLQAGFQLERTRIVREVPK